jgi:hypothetical protein
LVWTSDVEMREVRHDMLVWYLDIAEPDLALSVPERETPDSRLARSLSSLRLSNLSSPTLFLPLHLVWTSDVEMREGHHDMLV